MPNLLTSLQKYDLGHIRIVAELWGIELTSNDVKSSAIELCASLLSPGLLIEILEALQVESFSALEALISASGRIPWTEFTRKYGEIREVGPGKRDRVKPHLKPVSTAEVLFYRGLLARAFFNTQQGPQEFAYIPDDLYKLVHKQEIKDRKEGKSKPLGRPALAREKGYIIPATDYILDDATRMLAALRIEGNPPETKVPIQVLEELLRAANIIRASGADPKAVKIFLESEREQAHKILTDAWLKSERFNELRMLPGLIFEGEWENQPRLARTFLLEKLKSVPKGKWWSLSAFTNDIKAKHPDFQRPAGDYDSWYIKRQTDGQFLRGFEFWDQVDGHLIKYFITKILFWLGKVDVATSDEGKDPSAFRIIERKPKSVSENGSLVARSNGKITASRAVARVVRYQIARFCEWENSNTDEFVYQITPTSLTKANSQGLKVEHFLSLLAKHTSGGIPPVLVKALKRWEVKGTEARIQTRAILKVSRPEVLEELRKSKAARFLGEVLGPKTVIVKDGAKSKVLSALTELGLLAEEETEG